MRCRAQRWAQIAIAAMVVTMICVAAARAELTEVCSTGGVADGAEYEACASTLTVDTAAVRALLATCRGISPGTSSCLGQGGVFAWRDVQSLTSADLVVDMGGDGSWMPWSGWTFYAGAAGGGSGSGDDFSFADLNEATLAQLFGIGFVLVTTAWGLGKGIALVLRMAR